MDSLKELLAANDQQVARQLICAKGCERGKENTDCYSPVDSNTLLVMTPTDADFFADSYMQSLGNNQPARWAVLWQNTYDLPGGENISIQVHRFQSSNALVSKAVILCSLAQSPSEIRGMVLFAHDNGVPLEECRVECPWMTDTVYETLSHDFGQDWARVALANVGVISDESAEGVSLGRLLNLPVKALAYLPARIRVYQLRGVPHP